MGLTVMNGKLGFFLGFHNSTEKDYLRIRMSVSSKPNQVKEHWEALISLLTDRFSDGEPLDVEGVLYLIGLQELGQLDKRFKKDDNVNLIHIGICRVLEPYGYYRFEYYDPDGWPHFELLGALPNLKPGEQGILMKSAIVDYFLERGLIQ